jgi:LacI family transcriptional regulator
MAGEVTTQVSTRRVTLADVARTAGVSPTAASFVLSGRGRQMRISHDVERRVRQAASDLQYRPNGVSVSLRKGITRTIGFISDTVATTPHAGTLIKGALEAARERGNLLLIGETEGDQELERRLIQTMHDRRADGLILAAMYTRKIAIPKALTGMPTVLLNALPKRPATISSVIPDEIQAGRDAAAALLGAGHRDGIYLIGAGPGKNGMPPESVAAAERLSGIGETLTAAGITYAGACGCLEWEPEDGYRTTRSLLETARPRALICFNDRLALGAYQALHDSGLGVPGDVSVISFDDDPIASWIKPKLTTLALPHYELGRQAIDVLFGDNDRPQATGETAVYRVPMPMRERDSIREVEPPYVRKIKILLTNGRWCTAPGLLILRRVDRRPAEILPAARRDPAEPASRSGSLQLPAGSLLVLVVPPAHRPCLAQAGEAAPVVGTRMLIVALKLGPSARRVRAYLVEHRG